MNGFNNYFADIGNNLQKTIDISNKTIYDYLGHKKSHKFTLKPLNEDELTKIISRLKPKLSTGQDNLNNKIIKSAFPPIKSVVLHLINLSLTKGAVPPQLKTCRIVPIFKDGAKNDFGNYRPISLISAFGKLVEIFLNFPIKPIF